jgi:hypothetical protein
LSQRIAATDRIAPELASVTLMSMKELKALNMDGKRVYTLEELDRYIGSLPEWYYGAGERPETSKGERNGIQEGKGSHWTRSD